LSYSTAALKLLQNSKSFGLSEIIFIMSGTSTKFVSMFQLGIKTHVGRMHQTGPNGKQTK
ncbi:TPA: hypothetical protein ACF316_004716, partial [Escherichia coli]